MTESAGPRTAPPPMMLVWADVRQPGGREPRWLIGTGPDVYAALEIIADSSPYGMAARISDVASVN